MGQLADLKKLNALDLPALKATVGAALASGAEVLAARDEPATRGFGFRFRVAGGEWDLAFHVSAGSLPMPRTVLRSLTPRFAATLDLSPEGGLLVWIAKHLWLRDDEVGSPDFDRRFVVRTPDRAAAAVWLTPSLKRALIELRDADGGAYFNLRLRPEGPAVPRGLLIEKHGLLAAARIPGYLEIARYASGTDPSEG